MLAAGALVYIGWAFHIPPLTSILPGLATMKANTALCFVLLGLACVLRRSDAAAGRRWVRILAALVLLIALLTLAQVAFDVNLGIDELPFKDDLSSIDTGAPGRMSAPTAISFLLLSATILLEGRWSDRSRQRLAVIVLALGLSVFLSYPFSLAYGGSLFSYTGMALHTSLLLVLLATILIVEMPDRGWVDLILSRSALGENTRRLLGTALLIPFLLGWLISFGESQNWYDSGLGRSTYAVAVMLLMGLVVIYNAHRLQQAETAHRTLEANLSVVSRQLNSLVENSPSAIFIKDIDGRYQLVNSHFERLVQKTRAAIIGRKAEAIFNKSLLPAVLETDRRVIETRGVANVEIATELDGAQRIYLNTKFPLFNEAGEILGLGGIWTDITEQKQLSETLQIKNVDLERSNKELEQFAYVASHDLQEPLRMVSSYMQLLESRYKDKLDDDAKEFIDFAVDGAARMQRLIQDLLAFSRVGTRGKDPEIVDSSQSVAEALRNLKVRIEENGATVNAAGLPVVFVDRNQLTQVFQNLIGNAVKFKGDKPPVVDITARDQGEFFEFTVVDNGIGFDQKHADRIFTIFQRLNSREQYEGTGIGLSICKKIVERHGGKIWAEAAVGQGATFRFTLPKPPEEGVATGVPAAEAAAAAAEAPGADAIGERAGRMI